MATLRRADVPGPKGRGRGTRWLPVAVGLALASCGSERLVKNNEPPLDTSDFECVVDEDCPDGEICVFGQCVPVEELACEDLQMPLIHIAPLEVDFGEVVLAQRVEQKVTLSNVGECLLTISAVGLADGASPGFGCSPCDLTSYPKRLIPNGSTEVTVSYEALSLGPATGQLLVASDDPTVGAQGVVAVALSARYSGVPELVLDPSELSFGYVPYDPTQPPAQRTEVIRVSNQGTGNAALAIDFVYVVPGTDFSIPAELGRISPAEPVLLAPYDEADARTWLDVPVTFRPSRHANQQTMLKVHANAGSADTAGQVSARLAGSSVGPPAIVVSPDVIEFKTEAGEPLDLGMVGFRQVLVSNLGESELTVELGLDDSTGDYSLSPGFLAPVLPGASAGLGIYYAPSMASDLGNPGNPQRSVDAFLRVVSNDSDHVLITVPIHGWARSGVSNDVLKLVMTFDNDASGWAGNDFRDVDLELESPIGMACKKPTRHYVQAADGSYSVAGERDFCAEWSATGLEGQVSWIPGGAAEEPERILLYGLEDSAAEGGLFTVRTHYREDCKNLPTSLLADILGIGVSTLLGVLGGVAEVPIGVDPGLISDLIAENCWSHGSTVATVRVYVGEVEVAAPQTRLHARGDFADVIQLRRRNGTFEIAQ